MAGVAAGTVALLLATANRYGYGVDELYFRMLGERGPEWGYFDQPPLVPSLVRTSAELFGDSPTGIRVPAALCAAAVIVLGALICAELGGGRRAQTLTALGLGTSFLVLTIGHLMVTNTVDTVVWCTVALFALRALLRRDGGWWLWAGGAVGIGLYAKYVVLLLPVSLLAGLVLVGPREVLRDRRLWLGTVLALVIGAPNLVYQVVNDFPQAQMAEVLSTADGAVNRLIFLPGLLLLLGPVLVAFWVAGLVRMLREPAWRPVRAIGAASLVAMGLTLAGGGRADYVSGILILLFAAGCVVVDRWMSRRRWRLPLVAAGLALNAVLQIVMALPVLPERDAALSGNSNALESIGWPELVKQVAGVYEGLPAGERARAVVLTENFGEAGAVDRYGKEFGLPAVYSGHNELHGWGPPPESADVVIAVGVDADRLKSDFARCEVVTRVDNGLGVENSEQGRPILVCHGPRDTWARMWPAYLYLSGN